jgi:predicted aspartyl protease
MIPVGQFHVAARLTSPAGRTRLIELLVDTGATLLAIPRPVADELALVVLRTQPVVLANGAEEIWPISEIRLAIGERETTTPCFITAGGRALLGAVALESLFLTVDPVAKRLVPTKGYAAISAT